MPSSDVTRWFTHPCAWPLAGADTEKGGPHAPRPLPAPKRQETPAALVDLVFGIFQAPNSARLVREGQVVIRRCLRREHIGVENRRQKTA